MWVACAVISILFYSMDYENKEKCKSFVGICEFIIICCDYIASGIQNGIKLGECRRLDGIAGCCSINICDVMRVCHHNAFS